ncbi:DNA-directed rna polymerase II subunit, putative [Eimeria tenella]|uniref:DNA-directed rna polymerase II subunit, putative n=1 Tax=Eimeria tenella TaxID=5802 RepID=U6KVS5_EIMTE|nr:DNA-directed rna polymerase II subunit, putative [Eimeria tenella]CDJ41023.1 DNA-directed rna polymerase II subunit, putative [Eimeria tenella]|eukprot:XP_013231773.1 DNA-directed rna polymerase II subunit, putative [Eimeria tenella]
MSAGMMFCPECNNMLQPKEDRQRQQLKFLCRRCDFFRYAEGTFEENCVERINFSYKSKEDLMVCPELPQDPTLGRVLDWRCPQCCARGAVFFQLPERLAEDAMTLVYVCASPGCGAAVKQDAAAREDREESPESAERLQPAAAAKSPPPEDAGEPHEADGVKGIDEGEVDSEGDGDLFGEERGFGLPQDLEEDLLQQNAFDAAAAENELEKEIALQDTDPDQSFAFARV